MVLLNAIFRKQPIGLPENEAHIIYVLMKYRILTRNKSLGFSQSEAQANTTETMSEIKLSSILIGQAPDGIIFKIVKDYAQLLANNVNRARQNNTAKEIIDGKRLIIEHIERHRNAVSKLPEVPNFPITLNEYVFYRVCREVESIGGDDPEFLGFSREAVEAMTDIVKSVYQETVACPL